MDKRKKVLVSGYIGFSNFGDDALFGVLVEYLSKKNFIITALSKTPCDTKETYKVNSFYYKNYFKILLEIANSDILISGGGNLIQNETSTLSLMYYLFIILFAKLCFKKVIIFSQGFGPIDGKILNFLSKAILNMADLITVRDTYSKNYLKKAILTSDAFWNVKLKEQKKEDIIGIQLRNYKFLDKNLYNNLADLVLKYFPNYRVKIFAMENSNDTEECLKFKNMLVQKKPDIKVEFVPYANCNQVIEDFSTIKYLIAMRLHAVVLGLKYKVATLPLSYSIKTKNIACDLGLEFVDAKMAQEVDILYQKLIKNAEYEKMNEIKKFNFELVDKFLEG